MRQYELTILVHPDLEMNLQPAIDKVKKLIEDSGLKVTKEVNEGKKRMSYQIKGQDYAIYYAFDLEGETGAANQKIANALTISDEVLRHLLVKVDEKKVKMDAKRKERDAKRREYREAQLAAHQDQEDEEE